MGLSMTMTMALSMTMNLFCCMKETSRRIQNLHMNYERFDLDAIDDTECKAEFRFTKNESRRLAEAWNIPGTFFCHQGTTV